MRPHEIVSSLLSWIGPGQSRWPVGSIIQIASTSIKTIQNNKGEVASVIIALDRKEKKDNALEDEETMLILKKIPVVSIIDFFDILEFTRIKPELSSHQEPLLTYHEKYGIN